MVEKVLNRIASKRPDNKNILWPVKSKNEYKRDEWNGNSNKLKIFDILLLGLLFSYVRTVTVTDDDFFLKGSTTRAVQYSCLTRLR